MIIGSHNTMTYLPVKQWYLKPFFWMAKCQNKTIEQQYEAGARVFDLRIRFSPYKTTLCHGVFEYDYSIYELLYTLSNFNDRVYCRVILESNSKMGDQELQEKLFCNFCEYLCVAFPNIIFFGGNRKYDWKVIYNFGIPEPSLDDKYSSVDGNIIQKIWPWLYAKLNNKKNLKKGTDKDVLFIDFI